MSVSNRALRGTVISLIGQLGTQFLRFGSNIVLARLLPESAFGISAMIFAITTGLWLISDVGIGASIIRSEREDRAFLDTAWTLSVSRGAILFVIGSLLGPPMAWFYDEPQLVWLLPLCSMMVLLLAAESTGVYVAQRRLQVGRLTALEIIAQVAALAVSIPVAIYTQHVIALVAAAIVSALVKLIGSFLIMPSVRPWFAWDRPALKEIFSFGQWIFISTLFSFVAMRWDVFSLGRLEGFALLGIYGLASQIANVPAQIAMQVTSSVLTPVLADAWRGAKDNLQTSLHAARKAYVPAGMLLFLGAAATAPAFFIIAYKPGFHSAGPMAQVLMIPFWLGFLQEASSRALVAAGDGRGLALGNALRVVVTIVSTLIGFELFGFQGFIGAGGVGALVGMFVIGFRLRAQRMPGVIVDDLKGTAVFLGLLGFICLVPLMIEDEVGVGAAWLTLITGAVVLLPLAVVVVRRVKGARSAPAIV